MVNPDEAPVCQTCIKKKAKSKVEDHWLHIKGEIEESMSILELLRCLYQSKDEDQDLCKTVHSE
jgi:hypothetical protein